MDGLGNPIVALGIAKQGVSDVVTDQPVKLIFLTLSPKSDPNVQVRLLGLASRAARSRHLIQDLVEAEDGENALAIIQRWETLSDHSGSNGE